MQREFPCFGGRDKLQFWKSFLDSSDHGFFSGWDWQETEHLRNSPMRESGVRALGYVSY